ncbi:MAG: hypothetical protein AABX72_02310, partial [Nanoarchaeota archaeon]
LITHYQETILAAVFFLSLFLYKKDKKERMMIVSSFLLSFVLASWWILDFLKGLSASSLLAFHEGKRVFEFTKETMITNMLAFIIPLILIILIYAYLKRTDTPRRERMFYVPIGILAAAYTSRITTLIPLLRNISQDPYLMFFLFCILTVFFKEEQWIMQGIKKKIIPGFMIAVIIGSVGMNMLYTPWFRENTPLEKRMIEIFSEVNDKFIILGPLDTAEYPTPYSKPLYAYASIYHNLSTPEGWSPPLASSEYLLRLEKFTKQNDNLTCMEFRNEMMFFNTTNILAIDPQCQRFKECDFEEIKKDEEVCLYTINTTNAAN